MSWFSRLFERRTFTSTTTGAFGSLAAASGAVVNSETALHVPEVFAAIRAISEDVARTPLRLRQKIGPGAYANEDDHDLAELLTLLPNAEEDAFTFKRLLVRDLLLHGVAFAQVVRVDGRVVALWRLPAQSVSVGRDEQRRKKWTVSTATGRQEFIMDASRPPVLELRYDTPLAHCKDLIGLALAMMTYTSAFFKNGARPGGALTTDDSLDEEAVKRLRESWQAAFGRDGAHGTAVLEEGMKYIPFASPNDSAQLVELMAVIRSQLAGIFRIPPHKLGNLDRATFGNIEQQSLDYLSSLEPLFCVFEQSVRRDLLSTSEFGRYSIEFDRNALIVSDRVSLSAALATGRQNGWYSINDVRRRLGEAPISSADGGDSYLVNSALTPVTALAPITNAAHKEAA